MSSITKKKVHSPYYFKRKTLDTILKSREKYIRIYKNKSNSNRTNYSTFEFEKTPFINKNLKMNLSKSLLSKKKSNSQISLKKSAHPPIKLKFFSSSSKSNYKKFLEQKNKILNDYKNIIKNDSNIKINKEELKFSYREENKTYQKLNNGEFKPKLSFGKSTSNRESDGTKEIRTFNKKLTFRYLNFIINQYKYKKILQNEEEKKKDKLCLLNEVFKVKNFFLEPNQVIDYLSLNENNNLFFPSKTDKINNKYKKINFFLKNRILNRNRSAIIENKNDRIKNIYPTVLNIEGHRNRKILYELNDESKKKKKNDKPNCVYYRHHFNLQKRMVKEKNKVEQSARANPSDFAYKSQLLILSMNIYKRAIHQLQKKNSFKFNLDLPLYNLFLNFD